MSRQGERGVAVITAILVVAVAAVFKKAINRIVNGGRQD